MSCNCAKRGVAIGNHDLFTSGERTVAVTVCNDKSAYCCRKKDEVEVLFWNSVIPKQDAPNVEYFTRPLPAAAIEDATVTLSGFEANKEYEISVETVGYKMGDVYNAYLDMNLTDTPTREETAALKEASKPKQTAFTVTSDADGVIEFSLSQTENQVDFIKVKV